MPRSSFLPLSLLLMLPLTAVPGCGGGSTRGADSPEGSSSKDGYGDYGGSDTASECADGTCFACGDSYCPDGFFCHDNAPGGAGCSWLPECAETTTCSCVEAALGDGCTCEEREGGIHVTCE